MPCLASFFDAVSGVKKLTNFISAINCPTLANVPSIEALFAECWPSDSRCKVCQLPGKCVVFQLGKVSAILFKSCEGSMRGELFDARTGLD